MYKKLLIPTDGGELATRGLKHGLELARALGASVIILTVSAGMTGTDMHLLGQSTRKRFQDARDYVSETVKEVLDKASARAIEVGVEFELVHIENSYTDDAIIMVSEDQGADLIVMATHGRSGINRLIIGSETSSVIVRSKIPVLVVR